MGSSKSSPVQQPRAVTGEYTSTLLAGSSPSTNIFHSEIPHLNPHAVPQYLYSQTMAIRPPGPSPINSLPAPPPRQAGPQSRHLPQARDPPMMRDPAPAIPARPPPEPEQPGGISTTTVVQLRLRAFIKKTSAKLKCRRGKFTLSFDFTSDDGCSVQIYFFCTEQNPLQLLFTEARSFSDVVEFQSEAGKDLCCDCRVPDLKAVPLPDLTFTNQQVFPLVIVISPLTGEQAQVTYLKFQPDQHKLKVVPIRQRVVDGARSMETMEMYGIPREEDTECIICLSEPKDTAILPCNHLCVCQGCAQLLVSHGDPECPICRQPSTNYVRIAITR